jgi:NAD(P)-dependent dehydrogenase (short-subunit alcohol dehydrogenase family)
MTNPMDLSGKRILVTGASSGIGREASILMSRLGASMILLARDQQRLFETKRQLDGTGHLDYRCDLAELDNIPRCFDEIESTAGALHGVVHCAGVQALLPLQMTTESRLHQMMIVNVYAALSLIRSLSRSKGAPAARSVVLLSSAVGKVGQPGLSAYSATKGGVEAMCRSMALELASAGIRINAVAPGVVATEMTRKAHQLLSPEQIDSIREMHPLGFGTPLDVAHAIAFLVGDGARWITGTTLAVDGGYTAH